MGRKNDFIPFWTCYKNNKPYGNPYIQLTKEFFRSEAFRALPPMARLLYIDMAEAAAGSRNFNYTAADYMPWMSKRGFQLAKEALIQHGFISQDERAAGDRRPAVYHFTDDWKHREES